MVAERAWHDGLTQHDLRMVRLLVTAVCSIYNVSWAEVVAQDRHPQQCEARSWVVWSLYNDAGLRAAQVGRVVQRRQAQCHETIAKMRERRVTTPYLTTRVKLDTLFARLNHTDPLADENPDWYDALLAGEERIH